MSNPNKTQPWLDDQGEPLSLSELRSISKKWDEKTWNAYADWLETSRREHLADDFEDLVKHQDREEALRRYFEEERSDTPQDEEPKTFDSNSIAHDLSCLSHLEREVLILTFWDGKTEREIAECLEHSRGKVRKIYLRAMKKMKEMRIQNHENENQR